MGLHVFPIPIPPPTSLSTNEVLSENEGGLLFHIMYKNEFKYFIALKVKAKTLKILGENIG